MSESQSEQRKTGKPIVEIAQKRFGRGTAIAGAAGLAAVAAIGTAALVSHIGNNPLHERNRLLHLRGEVAKKEKRAADAKKQWETDESAANVAREALRNYEDSLKAKKSPKRPGADSQHEAK